MAEFKFFCPQCGQHILCDSSYSGQQINCPVCLKQIVVPQSPDTPQIPPPAPVYPLHQSTPQPAGHQYSGTPVANPSGLAQSNAAKNLLIIVVSVIVLAGIGVGGWLGYMKFRLGHYPAGLVGVWSGGNGKFDGQLVNGVGFAPGKVGQAFSFDGSSNYVQVADRPELNLTNELTIAFWAKRIAPGLHMIVEKGGDWTRGRNSFAVCLNDSLAGGSLCFNFTGGWCGCIAKTDLEWHHFAVTARNGDENPEFYLDGIRHKVDFRGPPIRLMPSASPMLIGSQVDPASGWNYFSQTMIDGLAIFNRVLSAEEIQKIYTSQK